MGSLRILSAAEQVAAHLRAEVLAGGIRGQMPGVLSLEAELGINRNTVEAALRLLEREGLLESHGPGRRRGIRAGIAVARPSLRIGILRSEPKEREIGYMVELQHQLTEAGHRAFFTRESLHDLGMNPNRVMKIVKRDPADAWVVMAGSRAVLERFVAENIPVMALFGRRRRLPVASVGPDKVPAMASATRALISLGHHRIVLLTRRMRRLPEPGATEQAFLDELANHGIAPGPYHLPDWEESVEGYYKRLATLFGVTPPTAVIVDEVPFFLAAQQFLAEANIHVPGEVSLLCMDASPDFDWCRPSVAHIRWDSRPLVRRIVKWADQVSHGRKDLRQAFIPAQFVPGGTIGPVAPMIQKTEFGFTLESFMTAETQRKQRSRRSRGNE